MLASYSSHSLPNGQRLAHAHIPESECAALAIYIPVGSRDENTNVPSGLAHFSEHMAFKGTKNRSAKELTLAIESGGGQANAYTSEDHTVYEAQGEAELMPNLLDTLAEMVWHSIFPKYEIELEKDVIDEEITMIRENPSEHIHDLLANALWPEHPLGQSISGTSESIAKIDQKILKKFAKDHHFRSDIVIATAGSMHAREILEHIKPLLPKSLKRPTPRHEWTPTKTENVKERRITDQLQLALGWHTPGRYSPERHALRLLSILLGESSSSRLFTELREERGLCYHIGSEISLFQETGALQITAGLDQDSRKESLETIFREVKDLASNGPHDEELARAKKIVISQSKLGFESTTSHAAWAGDNLLFHNAIPCPIRARETIMKVSAQEIRVIASQIFKNPPATAEILSSET